MASSKLQFHVHHLVIYNVSCKVSTAVKIRIPFFWQKSS